jgi:LysW-gamma-L-lysine carboxypeptidase
MSGLDAAERTLFDLVNTPSVSGSERAAAEVFVRHARALGLEAEIDEAGNAIAHRGPLGGIHLVLLGHIDTVPGEIAVRVEDGVLHGRGSVDAKGPLAAMLVAASRAQLPQGVRVTVAGAVGEETAGSQGARFLAERYRPQACIIGEPSGWDGVTLGYKGRLIATATVERENAHTAGPEASACDEVVAWWTRVERVVEEMNAEHERVFDRVQASLRALSSDEDGLRQRASAMAGFRLPPGVDPDELARRLGELAGDGMSNRFAGHERAIVSGRNDPVARSLSAAVRAEGGRPRPKLKTGTADFNVVGPRWGCPIAAYGPGDSSLDHTPHERLDLSEYRRSIAVLTRAIEGLAGELVDAKAEAIGVGGVS